jgi:putative nucleotidyltransferase with HDIG domain
MTLEQALSEDANVRRLPDAAGQLLRELNAPPRLAAHLRAVHDVACQIVDWLAAEYPNLGVDRAAVLFGAATHDIGKTVHTAELSAPGSVHELDGYRLLRERGVPERLARFARTHASWTAPGVELEDLLVSLADKVWKGKRVTDLEQLVVERLCATGGQQPWEVFLALDDLLGEIANDADRRLAFQASYPVRT